MQEGGSSIGAFSDAELDGDGHSEPSQCNSASSSSMHLPLVEQQQQQEPYHALADFDGYSSSGSHYGTGSSSDGRAYPAPPGSRDGGRFATSFGDLSLSDPAASSSSFMENNPEGNAPFFHGPRDEDVPAGLDAAPREGHDGGRGRSVRASAATATATAERGPVLRAIAIERPERARPRGGDARAAGFLEAVPADAADGPELGADAEGGAAEQPVWDGGMRRVARVVRA